MNHILTKKKVAKDTTPEQAEIDRLVYALCGRTEEEIAVVEGRADKLFNNYGHSPKPTTTCK